MKQLKIGSSWIRGVVGNGLTPELVTDFASAFGTYVDGREVVLARDTRRSSPMFQAAALSGLMAAGCDVANAGTCPTPVAQYLVRSRRAGGGLVISGSHNDSSWNALKFINAEGALLNPLQGEDIFNIFHAGAYTTVEWDSLGKETSVVGDVGTHLAATVARLDVAAIKKANFRVVFDLGNGSGGSVTESFCSLLGCRPVFINDETTGDFARDPAPTPANMRRVVW